MIGGSGLLAYLFRQEIKEGVGDTGAEVTRRTLEDAGVQLQARELARGVVYELLNDKKALELTTEFLNSLLEREQTRQAAKAFLVDILSQESTKETLKKLLQDLLSDQEFVEKFSSSLQHLSEKESTKTAVNTLLTNMLADIYIQEIAANFMARVLKKESVMNAAYDSSSDIVHSLLDDEKIKEHSVVWARDVLNQPDLHSKAGDAIWEALRYSFVPGFLRKGRPPQGIIQEDTRSKPSSPEKTPGVMSPILTPSPTSMSIPTSPSLSSDQPAPLSLSSEIAIAEKLNETSNFITSIAEHKDAKDQVIQPDGSSIIPDSSAKAAEDIKQSAP